MPNGNPRTLAATSTGLPQNCNFFINWPIKKILWTLISATPSYDYLSVSNWIGPYTSEKIGGNHRNACLNRLLARASPSLAPDTCGDVWDSLWYCIKLRYTQEKHKLLTHAFSVHYLSLEAIVISKDQPRREYLWFCRIRSFCRAFAEASAEYRSSS